MSTPKGTVGVIGCGNISKSYFKNTKRIGVNEVVACADLNPAQAQTRAQEFGIPRVCTVEEMLADKSIQFILNLTPPQAHFPIARAALENGKHVYNEKPLTVTRDEAQALRHLAKSQGLRIGCAPDTFLGTSLQICRQIIDSGKIGQPIAAEILFSLYPGAKTFDSFFWKAGAGILMDMSPYYFTALAMLLGPASRVTAFTRKSPAPQLQKADPDWKKKVEVPSHISAVVDYACGVMASCTFSYEVCGYYDIYFKIQGTEGTLNMPDPNMFHGEAVVTAFGKEKERIKAEGDLAQESRGIGLADMTLAIRENRPHLASDEIAFHVLDIMNSIVESANTGKAVTLTSVMTRPQPFTWTKA